MGSCSMESHTGRFKVDDLTWSVFACGKIWNLITTWDAFIGINRTYNLAINMCGRVLISYRYSSSEPL